jgi:lipoprotein-releasing system permease protein
MIVLEKIKDIGILKAIGATRKHIMTIFTVEGFLIGLFGTLLGALLGLSLSYLLKEYQFIKLPSDVYYIDKLPVVINPLDTVIIASAALFLSLVATLYPAISASRWDPVEAIRYE